jgi:hypothetical protein
MLYESYETDRQGNPLCPVCYDAFIEGETWEIDYGWLDEGDL